MLYALVILSYSPLSPNFGTHPRGWGGFGAGVLMLAPPSLLALSLLVFEGSEGIREAMDAGKVRDEVSQGEERCLSSKGGSGGMVQEALMALADAPALLLPVGVSDSSGVFCLCSTISFFHRVWRLTVKRKEVF